MEAMGIIGWVILGGLAGWVASKIMKTSDQQGVLANIMVGIAGALVGGWITNAFLGVAVTGLNIPSFIVAVFGAVVLIWLYKAVTARA